MNEHRDIRGKGRDIGQKIRRARKTQDWTQQELADRLSRELGLKEPLTLQAVSKWERGLRSDFLMREIEALTRVLSVNSDYFSTYKVESIAKLRPDTIAVVDEAASVAVPFVAYGEIRWDTVTYTSNIQHNYVNVFKTSFPPPFGGFWCYLLDESMEPLILKGRSKVIIGLRIAPEPEDLVMVQVGDTVLFRRFEYDREDQVLLIPINSKWRVQRFTQETWERDVKIIGIMTSFETPVTRSNFSEMR